MEGTSPEKGAPDPARDRTTVLQGFIDRLNAGDESAREQLIERACDRLRKLARKEIRGFPLVRRWEDTDDVLQGTLIRLNRALASVRPDSVRQFFGLCGTLIRRELIDLKRHHYGPEGAGKRHATHAPDGGADGKGSDARPHGAIAHEAVDRSHDPAALADWTDFHRQVEQLPTELREVFDLLWYQELDQNEAAAVLGVSSKTVNRRWREARLILGGALRGDAPKHAG